MNVHQSSETEKGIFEEILKGHLDLETSPWPSISTASKDLIRKMLTVDPNTRISAAQALGTFFFFFFFFSKIQY